jgi:hypothetical protein
MQPWTMKHLKIRMQPKVVVTLVLFFTLTVIISSRLESPPPRCASLLWVAQVGPTLAVAAPPKPLPLTVPPLAQPSRPVRMVAARRSPLSCPPPPSFHGQSWGRCSPGFLLAVMVVSPCPLGSVGGSSPSLAVGRRWLVVTLLLCRRETAATWLVPAVSGGVTVMALCFSGWGNRSPLGVVGRGQIYAR